MRMLKSLAGFVGVRPLRSCHLMQFGALWDDCMNGVCIVVECGYSGQHEQIALSSENIPCWTKDKITRWKPFHDRPITTSAYSSLVMEKLNRPVRNWRRTISRVFRTWRTGRPMTASRTFFKGAWKSKATSYPPCIANSRILILIIRSSGWSMKATGFANRRTSRQSAGFPWSQLTGIYAAQKLGYAAAALA